MTDGYIQTIPDSTGKKCRTLQETVGGQTVQTQVIAVEDGAGAVIKPALEDGGNLEAIADGIAALGGLHPNSTRTTYKATMVPSYSTSVTQWTYTVPSNRKAIVEHMQIHISPIISNTPASGDYTIAEITLNDNIIMLGRKDYYSTAPNIEPINVTSGGVSLEAGDVLKGVYASGTMNKMWYSLIAEVLEYDA